MSGLRLGSYNVRNLFLDRSPPGRQGPHQPRKRRAALRALARVVGSLNADVLALQEVGSAAALAALNNLLARPYPHADLLAGNSDRGIQLAILSRLPIQLASHADLLLTDGQGVVMQDHESAAGAAAGTLQPLKLQRDLLRCEVSVSGTRLAIFSVHLKSPNRAAWCRHTAEEVREAECRGVADVVTRYQADHPQARVLLVGDFNAPWDSSSLAPLRAASLVRVPLTSPEGQAAGTYWPNGGIAIDHVLATATALHSVAPDSGRVHASKLGQKASDHYAVSVELLVAGAPGEVDAGG